MDKKKLQLILEPFYFIDAVFTVCNLRQTA